MFGSWTPLVYLVATLLPLLWAVRWITRHLQELSIRWVGDADVALVIYFVLLLPGVIIHEVSHWLMARVLGVPVQRFSLGPVRKGRGGRVSLGSIQVSKVDPVREGLIGMAPLIGGSAVILLIGNLVLGVGELTQAMGGQGVEGFLTGLGQLVQVADFWLWLYLIFAVSNAMLPSEADRNAMRSVLVLLGILAVILLVASQVTAIPEEVTIGLDALATYLTSAFAITLAVDILFMLVIGVLVWFTRRAQGTGS
jgi:hypothetical protein